jgi:hypothetical protein
MTDKREVEKMKENYILQNTNYKQKDDHASKKLLNKPQGSHGLNKGSFKLQTMTALMKSFCGGSRCCTGRFSRKEPPWPLEARNER